MSKKTIYDVTFKSPFNCIIGGSSGSGKTQKIPKKLKVKDVICKEYFYRVHYFFNMWQPSYDEMKTRKLVDNFIEGIPDIDTLMTMIDFTNHSSSSKH